MSRNAARLAVSLLLLLGGAASAMATRPGSSSAAGGATTTLVTSPASTVLSVSGHGWGHGLGMSQWGAYGYALHGFGYERILSHYYPGTTLGPEPGRTLRILVAAAKRLTLASVAPWRAVDAKGRKMTLDPGAITVTAAGKLDGREMTMPVRLTAPAPLQVNGIVYRGRLSVSLADGMLQVIDALGIETYLRGVVPSEMPSNWPDAALQAQAVAARSYALANLVPGRAFDLYGDERDQVYGGVAAESPTTDAAIAATKGQVVLYAGRVADTLYFSTSGGRTASSAESLGTPVPYLVSVSDPYDTTSPYHDWGPVLFEASSVAKKLKVAAPLGNVQTAVGTSGRVQSMTIVGGDDAQATLTGSQVRAALGLRSTWFTPALLGVGPRAATITYGGATTLQGIVVGAGPASLESKPYGQDWQAGPALQPGTDGTFSAIVKPQARTAYRLAAGAVRAGLATIAVAARCDATIASSGAQGTVRPAAAGTVQLQRGGGAWATVSSTVADAAGAFSFGGPLAPGSYRARCAPGAGIAPGLSAEVTVP